MSSVQITIAPDSSHKVYKYLASCCRFSSFVSVSIDARNQLSFAALNAGQSCYATLSLSSTCFSVAASNRLGPENGIFAQAFRVPLKPLVHFISKICANDVDVCLELSKFGISLFSNPDEGCSVTYKTHFESTPQLSINLAPFERFPNQILGCDLEWFFTLLHSVSKATIKTASVIALQCIPGAGLRIALPGNEEAQVTLGSSQFANYVAVEFDPILISLTEFTSFLAYCKRVERPADLFFGSAGQPLVATFSSVDGINCRFILSTLSAQSVATADAEPNREIPASDEEDDTF